MTGTATGGAPGHGDEHMNGHVQDELPALLGGELPLDVTAAREAIAARIGRPLGLGAEEAAARASGPWPRATQAAPSSPSWPASASCSAR